jgi:hypothetical protein
MMPLGEGIIKDGKRQFREIVIPGDVLDDERLSDGAKIMYGKIARLSFKEGYCWAGNSFLDGTKSGRNASRFIAELKNAGYVVIENERSKYREIRICPIKSKVNLASCGEVAEGNPDGETPSTSPDLARSDSLPRRNWRGNIASSGEVHLANNGDITLQDSTNLNSTAAASPIPEPDTDPTPEPEPAAAAPFVPGDLKEALRGLDSTLILDDDFYPRAAAFMARHGLDGGYPKWIYRLCENKDSVSGYFFRIFLLDTRAEQYRAVRQAAAESRPPPDENCPACGTPHAKSDGTCPACGLPANSPEDRVRLFRELAGRPAEQRDDYFRREIAIHAECGKDFVKIRSLICELRKEFGLETA